MNLVVVLNKLPFVKLWIKRCILTVGLVSAKTKPIASPWLTPIVYGRVNTDEPKELHSPRKKKKIHFELKRSHANYFSFINK